MRNASLAILRKIGVETGGSNVQFAVHPQTGRMIVIEMNPTSQPSQRPRQQGDRLSHRQDRRQARRRFPARRDSKRHHPRDPRLLRAHDRLCGDESSRWAFEKFPEAVPALTTQMKSVGEVMAIGRTFKESLQKALRGLEVGRFGLGCDKQDFWGTSREPKLHEIKSNLATPNPERVWWIRYALLAGLGIDQIHALTGIDPWFLANIEELIALEERLAAGCTAPMRPATSFCSRQSKTAFPTGSSRLCGTTTEAEVRRDCRRRGIRPVFKLVDTCAAEFEAVTPYYYSTYESRRRGSHRRSASRRDPGRRSQPHRPGHRI